MPYVETATGQFGLGLSEIRLRLPNVGIPDGIPNLSELGYIWYDPTPGPFLTDTQRAIETAPINGLQVWSVESLTTDELTTRELAKRPALIGKASFKITTGILEPLPISGVAKYAQRVALGRIRAVFHSPQPDDKYDVVFVARGLLATPITWSITAQATGYCEVAVKTVATTPVAIDPLGGAIFIWRDQ